MSHGNTHVADQVEVMQLTEASQLDRQNHQALMLDLEAKKLAFQVDVPTLPNDVRKSLRSMGLPVRLFGENLANVRDRLRMELARREILQERGIKVEDMEGQQGTPQALTTTKRAQEEEEVTKKEEVTKSEEEEEVRTPRKEEP